MSIISIGFIPISIELTVFAKKVPLISIISARLIKLITLGSLLIFISDFPEPKWTRWIEYIKEIIKKTKKIKATLLNLISILDLLLPNWNSSLLSSKINLEWLLSILIYIFNLFSKNLLFKISIVLISSIVFFCKESSKYSFWYSNNFSDELR